MSVSNCGSHKFARPGRLTLFPDWLVHGPQSGHVRKMSLLLISHSWTPFRLFSPFNANDFQCTCFRNGSKLATLVHALLQHSTQGKRLVGGALSEGTSHSMPWNDAKSRWFSQTSRGLQRRDSHHMRQRQLVGWQPWSHALARQPCSLSILHDCFPQIWLLRDESEQRNFRKPGFFVWCFT